MVVLHTFQDIIDDLPDTETYSLPAFKQIPLKIEFNNCDCRDVKPRYDCSQPPLPFANSEIYESNIIQWRRLTASEGDCKAVYEVQFDVEEHQFNFKAGDTIGVMPHNDATDVNFVITHLELESTADLTYTLSLDTGVKGSKIPMHVPASSTLRHVLTHCLDLRSVLKKLFLLALSKYTKDSKERKSLEYLCSKEGSTAYTNHILNKSLCLLDIFSIFKSCRPPVEVLLANLPRLLPRPYSVVNSGLKNNKIVNICFSVMASNNRKGLTTGWLESMILNNADSTLENQIKNLSLNEIEDIQTVPIYLRKNFSMFSLPESIEIPLILIGPGTGVAPFIAFLEEREYLKNINSNNKLGETWLFFGCRNPELDFIYEEELNGFLSSGTLTKLCTAFSRENNNEVKYIQDALLQNSKEVTRLIREGASVYICGDLKSMTADVKEILTKCIAEHDSMTLEEAQSKITEMEKSKRYVVDAWS